MEITARHALTETDLSLDVSGERVKIHPSVRRAENRVFLSPGWVDLQVNGFAGYDLNAPELSIDDVRAITARLWQEGVTAWCPTLISGPPAQVEHHLQIIARACESDPHIAACIPGIHLEGPYISPAEGTHGAHPPQYIHPPDWAEFSRWQQAAGGRIRIVTLAPEVQGAIEFTRRLTHGGVIVGLGHTRASTAGIAQAVEAGARLATHLGNGIEATLPRHPNPIWDQLAEDRLSASLIFDGFHLPASVMKVILRAKGVPRCLLVSDASTLARCAPGIYDTPVGGRVQLHPDGRLSIFGTEYLAGSASSLKDGVQNALCLAGCSLAEAIQLVSTGPSRLLGIHQDAATVFSLQPETCQVTIRAVIIAGQVKYLNQAGKSGG